MGNINENLVRMMESLCPFGMAGMVVIPHAQTYRTGLERNHIGMAYGTFLKLVETDEGEGPTDGPDLVRLVNTNMNVADLERSREFYRLLGFTEEEAGSQAGSGDFAAAHGFIGPIEFEGVGVSLPGTDPSLPLPVGDDEATLQLRQWKTPFNSAPPYSPPVNHLGIDRIAFYVDDLNATIDEMNRLGFEQLGPIGGGATVGSVGIVFFYDLDGIKVGVARK